MTVFDDKDKKPGGLSEDDSVLWEYVTRSVQKLEQDKEAEAELPLTPRRISPAKTPQSSPAVLYPVSKTQTSPGRELDKRTSMRLRRGQMDIEALLDLHGMGQEEAHTALTNFVLRSYRQGLRHILVITGKGRIDDRGRHSGVLRKAVPVWLEEAPLQDIVLEYHRAKPRDGGDGALYILLRRQRPT